MKTTFTKTPTILHQSSPLDQTKTFSSVDSVSSHNPQTNLTWSSRSHSPHSTHGFDQKSDIFVLLRWFFKGYF
ncbi:hypothetical protein LOK49_LG10G02777 [Camellia lanceoleosa]|uniref:Uncharacterized protein n=1 Tax=Camellia lanceoleosa TaxID=1840588 RepID=A0ACC0GAL1_9ERIC|nr:hypothetical protein LOK49_LG10G02777 [Camellia lanceoleosa]